MGAPKSATQRSADEDRVLIEKARYGDPVAFENLVAKYQDRCVAIARRFLYDEDGARDVAQEAFLRLYKTLDRYDPAQRFYTWFYRIVVHLAIDHMRRLKHVPRRLGDWDEHVHGVADPRRVSGGTVPGGAERIEAGERRGQIEEILARLPRKYRMLLVLRDMEGFTSKEIAEVAHWNHATVRWRLHRARKLFREAWDAAGYEAS